MTRLKTGDLADPLIQNSSQVEQYDSYRTIVWRTGRDVIELLISFNYNLQTSWILWQIGHVSNGNQGDNTKSLSAAVPTMFLFDTGILIPGYMCLVPIYEIGELLNNIKNETSDEKKKLYKRNIESVIKNTAFLTAPLVAMWMVVLAFSRPIVNALAQDEEIADMAQAFLLPASVFIPSTTIRFTLQQILLAYDPEMKKRVIAICLSSLGVGGVFLSYALGFGIEKLHIPALGVKGILIAMGVENALCLGGLIICATRSKFFKQYRFVQGWNRENWDEDWSQIKKLFGRALHIVGANVSELGPTLAKTFMAVALGSAAGAAYNGAGEVILFTLAPALGCAIASLTNVSKAISNAKGHNQISREAHGGLIVNWIAGIIFLVPVIAYPKMVNIFTGAPPEVMPEEEFLARIIGAASFFYMSGLTMLYTLRILPNMNKATYAFYGWLLASTPAAGILAFPLKLGTKGIGYSTLGFTLGAFIHLLKYYVEAFPLFPAVSDQEDKSPLNEPSTVIEGEGSSVSSSSSGAGVLRPHHMTRHSSDESNDGDRSPIEQDLEKIEEGEEEKEQENNSRGCLGCLERGWNTISSSLSSGLSSISQYCGSFFNSDSSTPPRTEDNPMSQASATSTSLN